MADALRSNQAMIKAVTKEYDTALYSGDQGMWTVIEITKRQVAKVASQHAAEDLVRRLKIADKPQDQPE
jgi:hypothetical protein